MSLHASAAGRFKDLNTRGQADGEQLSSAIKIKMILIILIIIQIRMRMRIRIRIRIIKLKLILILILILLIIMIIIIRSITLLRQKGDPKSWNISSPRCWTAANAVVPLLQYHPHKEEREEEQPQRQQQRQQHRQDR